MTPTMMDPSMSFSSWAMIPAGGLLRRPRTQTWPISTAQRARAKACCPARHRQGRPRLQHPRASDSDNRSRRVRGRVPAPRPPALMRRPTATATMACSVERSRMRPRGATRLRRFRTSRQQDATRSRVLGAEGAAAAAAARAPVPKRRGRQRPHRAPAAPRCSRHTRMLLCRCTKLPRRLQLLQQALFPTRSDSPCTRPRCGRG